VLDWITLAFINPKNCLLIIDFILIMKPTRCTNFSNLFWNVTLKVSDNSFVHHQDFFIVHTALVYVIQVCWQLASRKCGQKLATIQHITRAYRALAQGDYTHRHDYLADIVHWQFAFECGLSKGPSMQYNK